MFQCSHNNEPNKPMLTTEQKEINCHEIQNIDKNRRRKKLNLLFIKKRTEVVKEQFKEQHNKVQFK